MHSVMEVLKSIHVPEVVSLDNKSLLVDDTISSLQYTQAQNHGMYVPLEGVYVPPEINDATAVLMNPMVMTIFGVMFHFARSYILGKL